jgi:hypothetical protein
MKLKSHDIIALVLIIFGCLMVAIGSIKEGLQDAQIHVSDRVVELIDSVVVERLNEMDCNGNH